MKYQTKNKPYCAPTALGNALRMYGKKVSNRKLIDVTDAAKNDGCNEFLLMQGIRELGFNYEEIATDSTTHARNRIGDLWIPRPTLLCVHTDNAWDHWVCVFPCTTDRWFLFDSENNSKNHAENGCHVVSWRQLVRLWRAPAKEQVDVGDKSYYGIQVVK